MTKPKKPRSSKKPPKSKSPIKRRLVSHVEGEQPKTYLSTNTGVVSHQVVPDKPHGVNLKISWKPSKEFIERIAKKLAEKEAREAEEKKETEEDNKPPEPAG